MAEWPLGDEWGAGKGKKASSGRMGPSAISGGGRRQETKGTDGTKGTERAPGQRGLRAYPRPMHRCRACCAGSGERTRSTGSGVRYRCRDL